MKGTIKFLIVTSIIVYVYLGFVTSVIGKSNEPATQQESRQDKEQEYIYLNKNRLKSVLKDPESAEFSGVFVSYLNGSPVVCGYVNSKNSFGGFSGTQRFVSAGTVQVTEDMMRAGEMESTWAKACNNQRQ